MYKLKSIVRRSTSFTAAMALVVSSVGSAVLPTISAYADSLNPLTERSLTLSSSSPGWDYLDGSGNTKYAPANSGANGQKVGNTFEFKVSTNTGSTDLKAMSFQYCTTPAGNCLAPGDNGWNATPHIGANRNNNTTSTSDLNVTVAVGAGATQATLSDYVDLGGAGTGTITATTGTATVTGVGTAFLTQLHSGDTITSVGTVLSVESNTSLTLAANAASSPSGAAFTYGSNGRPWKIPAENATGENYMVYKLVSGTKDNGVWEADTGWTMTATTNEAGPDATGKNNEIRLSKSGGTGFTSGQLVRVVFFATDTNYITNPGSGAFFVRINTYDNATSWSDDDVIDGGVTVANVMNQGIQITTKVLETMSFSVGVVDPYNLSSALGASYTGTITTVNSDDDVVGVGTSFNTELAPGDIFVTAGGNAYTVASVADATNLKLTSNVGSSAGESGVTFKHASSLIKANGHSVHSVCEPVVKKMKANETGPTNRLQIGDPDGEFSLSPDVTYSSHSFFRLSSNSSAGATVYYSGNTLTNTVEDEIAAIGIAKKSPVPGGEQFGLALDLGSGSPYATDYAVERDTGFVFENGVDNAADSFGVHSTATATLTANPSWHTPQLAPLVPADNYNDGSGVINTKDSHYGGATSTKFAFDTGSKTVPVPLASEDTDVVDCVTGKIRYIANIAATTPAGIYTTKVNYIASPQY